MSAVQESSSSSAAGGGGSPSADSQKQHLSQMAFDQKSTATLGKITDGKNPRGIPGAKFIVSAQT